MCISREYESRFSDYRLYTDYFHRKYRIVSRKYSASQRVFGVYSSFCERNACPVLLIGHINKEGSIAGPKVLEHIVDTVLQFEGDQHYMYRILRGIEIAFR